MNIIESSILIERKGEERFTRGIQRVSTCSEWQFMHTKVGCVLQQRDLKIMEFQHALGCKAVYWVITPESQAVHPICRSRHTENQNWSPKVYFLNKFSAWNHCLADSFQKVHMDSFLTKCDIATTEMFCEVGDVRHKKFPSLRLCDWAVIGTNNRHLFLVRSHSAKIPVILATQKGKRGLDQWQWWLYEGKKNLSMYNHQLKENCSWG